MFEVRKSPTHGNGAYATQFISAGTVISEYVGKLNGPDDDDIEHASDNVDPNHTFSFTRSDGYVINAAIGGNDSRYINHSCEPNCESYEDDHARVWIKAIKDIEPGTELSFDYRLCIDEPMTDELVARYKCLCGVPTCRGTMLDLSYVPDLYGQRRFQDEMYDFIENAEALLYELQETLNSQSQIIEQQSRMIQMLIDSTNTNKV